MGNKQSYITLDSCITDYLGEGEHSQHKYFKCWHLAFRGLEQLGMDFFYRIQSVKLPINANMTVTLPADYLNWTKVGVLNDRGEIIPMYYNDKLTTYADLSPDRLSKTQDDTLVSNDWGVNTWSNYWNGGSYTNIYGVPSGSPFVGSFKIDTENGVILLNESFAYDYILLEYVASPVQGQDYYLPVQFREALIAWLWWKDSKTISVRRGQVGVNRDLKSDFYNERKNAIARWKPIRKQEILQASQEMTRLAVKS
jgi:hypothetical protein